MLKGKRIWIPGAIVAVVALVVVIVMVSGSGGSGRQDKPHGRPIEYVFRACTPENTQCEVIDWTVDGADLTGESWVEVMSDRTHQWVREDRAYQFTGTRQGSAFTGTGVPNDGTGSWSIEAQLHGRTLHLTNGDGHVEEHDLTLASGYPKSANASGTTTK
ncbi:hypothetical protein [Actinoallomurus sp. NPDC050550]|uniref:hypothetical protein n=1 Tax=Actinoallomurus sp. NPDC050550 TaxID=3154937 RepID=UPI003406AFAF